MRHPETRRIAAGILPAQQRCVRVARDTRPTLLLKRATRAISTVEQRPEKGLLYVLPRTLCRLPQLDTRDGYRIT